MPKRSTFFTLSGSLVLLAGVAFSQQADSLAKRIGHYDPKTYPTREGIHDGAGSMAYGNLVDVKYVQGNWVFFQRGVLNPHSSIGEHFHLATEEMFVIFDGDAQFTVDGRTAVVRAPAAVPVRLGHEHAVYNPTDRPMQWMNVSVSVKKGVSGAFNMGDTRVDAALDAIPQFISMRFDRALLKPVDRMNGGTGAVQYRRALQPSMFSTSWAYVDHLLLNPGASAGPASQADISEIYYVMKGAGTVTVDREMAPIKEGDGIPVDMGQTRSFTQSGPEPLEMLVVGVARDMTVKGNMSDSVRTGEAPKVAR